jgi:hypothetical protein
MPFDDYHASIVTIGGVCNERYGSPVDYLHAGFFDMRPYKRATMIARSIIKMIEDCGGGPPDVAAAIVRLPGATFDHLCLDADKPETITEMRVQGVTFKRDGNRKRAN